MVTYKKDILLRIPMSATNLSLIPRRPSEAKLSFEVVAELVDLAGELNISSKKGNAT
jgi:hypothetical protein